MIRQSRLRILIVRLSAMGDVIHAMPAVAALRAALPQAHIAWAIEPAWAPLLQGPEGTAHSADTVHLVPWKRWARSLMSPPTWREMRALQRQLRDGSYDIALDLQGNIKSGITMYWSTAPCRIGEAEPRELPARLFSNEVVAHTSSHVIEQGLELASRAAGHPLAYMRPTFAADVTAERWADNALRVLPCRGFAMMLPGAGWGSKRWPAENYGAVAAALHAAGVTPLVNVGPGEEMIARSVVAASGNTAVAVSTTIPQLIAVTRRAALCIGGDTGPLHLACALNIPTVAIYGPTDPARNGPYGAPHLVLRSAASVRDHSRVQAPEAGLLTITTQDVLAAVKSLLPDFETSEVQP